jgi:TnpA family transposase
VVAFGSVVAGVFPALGFWSDVSHLAENDEDGVDAGLGSANFMTEWHQRYGGAGIMVYWHVERRSVCIYSQVTSTSASEVASMIEGLRPLAAGAPVASVVLPKCR